jgi:hypothetical protein
MEFLKMKTAKLLIPLMLLAIVTKAQQHPATKKPAVKTQAPTSTAAAPAITGLPTDEFYEHFVLKHADTPTPEGYGLSVDNMIPVGIYVEDLADPKKVSAQLNRFLKTYLWADGSEIIFIDHKSAMINGVNADKFRVTKTGTKDTLTLYADEYKTAPVAAPKGFRFFTKAELAAQLVGPLTKIREFNATPDKYADAKAKTTSLQILSFLQSEVGLDYLMDNDNLAQVLNDVGVDLDLKAFLVRSYIFHKFDYEATGQTTPLIKAYNAMVDDYQTAIKAHEIFSKGNLATYLVKK